MSIRPFVALALVLALTACGGGGGSGSSSSSSSSSSSGGSAGTPGDRVAVSLAAPVQTLPGGAAFSMTLLVSNPSSTSAANVRIQIDMGFAFSRGAAVCTARSGAVCPTSTTSLDVATLPAGGELEFTIPVNVSSGASGPNTTTVTATANDEIAGANNEARLVISAYTPDVFVSVLTAGSNYSGSVARYPMKVGNDGPDMAREVLIENVVGPGQTLSSIACTASGGAVCPTTLGAVMTVPSLPTGGVLDFLVTASIAPDLVGVISNTLRVATAGDQNPSNNFRTSSGTTRIATSPSSQSFVMLNSDPNDWVGLGGSYYYDRTNAMLEVIDDESGFRVIVNGDENWGGGFSKPGATGPIVPGVGMYPPGWSGEGRGCNRTTGTFTVDAVTYVAGSLASIDLRFEQHCEGAGPALYGQVHWVVDDDLHPPGPVNPPPAGLWQPDAGATPASGNYVYLQSDGGDYVGRGRPYTYTQSNSVLEVNITGNELRVNVTGNERWDGFFEGLDAVATLPPGYYGGLQRWPTHNPVKGGLSWGGEGRGCNVLSGWFSIDNITIVAGAVTSLDLRFEQHCENMPAALRGKVHWASGDPTQPVGPVFPPPANLWRPAAGATPATGNYVYLKSEAGDYIGEGRSYTHTQTDSVLGVAVSGARLSVSVEGFQNWAGEFQGMNTLQQLQPGYYPNLMRYPFHNPVVGGLTWSGNGRGCNRLTGWYVIDSISFAGGNLASVDLRFEQHCDGGPALNGQIHWVAGDPAAPPGPQQPPPSNLWQPAAGATPATGNYVYLTSDPGDWVGDGRTYTYTPANSTLTTQSGVRFFQMNVAGQEDWTGNFMGMNAIEAMQPGYYGEIQRYGGNPTRGSMDWGGEGRGCNTISGWFVIDSITFAGTSLASIEMRFEQHCEGATPALRGKIRWVR